MLNFYMAQNNKKDQKNEDEKSGSPFRRAPAQVMGNRAGEMLIEKRAREGSPNIQKTEKCTGKRTCKKQKP
jgi:hypothetical protein